ncbi:MAG: FkbM family methyltransferase [Cyanobacteria bacterium REEB494]|nr:FkbM family methyltransferase [Cyanobacteria bacterium REEB494]
MNVVNIGANDGADHVLKFCLSNKDKIESIHLVEPILAALKLCEEKYRDFDNAIFHNKAITETALDSAILYYPQNDPTSAHSSLNKEHLLAHGHFNIGELAISAQTISEFLEQSVKNQNINLYIDTEGRDCQILLTLDLGRFDIRRIEFEVLHSDGPFKMGQNYVRLIKKLLSSGFREVPASQYNEAYTR